MELDCQSAFDEIKQAVANPPVLAHFDISGDTIVACDASDTALGACLLQVSADGQERPVAFASRVLSPAERKYLASSERHLRASGHARSGISTCTVESSHWSRTTKH